MIFTCVMKSIFFVDVYRCCFIVEFWIMVSRLRFWIIFSFVFASKWFRFFIYINMKFKHLIVWFYILFPIWIYGKFSVYSNFGYNLYFYTIV